MRRLHYVLISALSAGVSINAASQTIDPTVEVSRTYEGKIMEVHKPMLEMQIPDSVMHFDLDFDYSVFESPYKGTYEFNPYLLSMKPHPDAWSGRKLYLRAGAGYPLHPVFDLVWTPDLQGGFRMSVYASHRSFIGGYRGIGPVTDGNGIRLDAVSRYGGNGQKLIAWSGHDMLSKAGVNGRVDWTGGTFTFDVGYYGLATRDSSVRRSYDALDASFRARSNYREDLRFFYDAGVVYRYAEDKLSALRGGNHYLGAHELGVRASAGPVFSGGQRLSVDVGTDVVSYGGMWGTSAGNVWLSPKYVLDSGRWSVSAGVRLSCLIGGGNAAGLPGQDSHRGQYVYPDIRVGYDIVTDFLNVYADLGGGDSVGRYSSLIDGMHFITPLYSAGAFPLLDNTVERVSASVGFTGNIASKFTYDVKGGYRNFANAPLFSTFSASPELSGMPAIGLAYAGYSLFYASLDCAWKSEDFSFGGNFTYRNTGLENSGIFQKGESYLSYFTPAEFSGYVKAMYNWRGRIFAGVDCDFALGRRSAALYVNDYADLGLYMEFKAARLFSFWLRGGNLIDMTVQRMPLYAESGINFTAGICLNL